MRSAYRILASLLALLVVVQAAAIAYAYAGLGIWVDGGGVLDKAAMESDDMLFDEIAGFIVHGINGMMVIPLIALALFVVSFFARVPKGIPVAGALLVLVVVQVVLGLAGHDLALAGLLHGVNALVILIGAVQAATLAGRTTDVTAGKAPAQA